MSTTTSNTPKPAAITAEGTVPLTPEQIVEQLRILRQHIPDFEPLSSSDLVSMRAAASVDERLVTNATDAVGTSPFLAGAVGKDADTLRGDRAETHRWSAVEAELRTMYKGVVSANLTRRYRLGITSLQAYSIARQLVRQEVHAILRPHVEAMRAVMNRRVRRQPAEPVAPAQTTLPPVPAPAQPPVTR
jgi:hypothetical protein